MPEPIPVRVRDCACPDTPHPDGDVVYLAPTLSLAGGIAATQDRLAAGLDADDLTRRWLVTFVRYGAIGWNWLDDAGKPRPFDVNVLLEDHTLGTPVSDAAADRYSEDLLRPLAPRPSATLQHGPTAGSTSATRPQTPRRPGSSSPRGSAGRRSTRSR